MRIGVALVISQTFLFVFSKVLNDQNHRALSSFHSPSAEEKAGNQLYKRFYTRALQKGALFAIKS
jgi:hypothetical protein